jgi:hypothetical protein
MNPRVSKVNRSDTKKLYEEYSPNASIQSGRSALKYSMQANDMFRQESAKSSVNESRNSPNRSLTQQVIPTRKNM